MVCKRGYIPLGGEETRPWDLHGALPPSQCQFHIHLLPLLSARPEHRSGLQFHHPRDEDIRELRNTRVVGIDSVVEKLAAVGDSLPPFCDAILQRPETLAILKLGTSPPYP